MRNLYKPNRFKVAGIQAQQTLGGDVMQADEEGDYVEFRDYRRALDEIEMLKHTVKYWEIEAQTDHARWLGVLEDYERLKDKSNCQAECLDAFDVKMSQAEAENARLKAEVERLEPELEQRCHELNLSLGQQAVQLRQIAELKAEVERLNGIILAQSSDFVRSKTADDGIKPEGHNDLAGRAVERCLELQAENERLAGEVNRLYLKTELLVECGDEMANRAGQEWCPTWVVEDWNKAKEGKQS